MDSMLLERIFTFARLLRDEIHAKIDPLGYARSIGVQVGEGTVFYGMRPGMFSSEPFLVSIGKSCHITSGVQFVTHDGGPLILRHKYPDLDYTAPINVGNYVYIGMRSMLLPGVSVGSHSVIGAGSIITRDIPSGSVAVGCPARVICGIDEYVEKLNMKSTRLGHLRGLAKEKLYIEYFRVNHPFRSRLRK